MIDSYSAANDFKKARGRASLEKLMSRITGRSTELLSYEDVRQAARASGVLSQTLVDVPLDSIVGSVNRYKDFTRTFLPRQDNVEERWISIYKASSDVKGLPPIDLYRIGDVYFVQDGHHRVSVARQMGFESIQAYVTEIRSNVPIDLGIQPDELILKAEFADFLQRTEVNVLFPEIDFTVTRTGQYQKLREHMAAHRYYMGLDYEREITNEEATTSWVNGVYLPVVGVIRELGILHNFPDRTETDLYLWISKHKAEKEAELGWQIPDSAAAEDLAETFGENLAGVSTRIGRQLVEIVLPENLEPRTPKVERRKVPVAGGAESPLFRDILVPIGDSENSLVALEQALEITSKEGSAVKGLFVVSDEVDIEKTEMKQIRDRFFWRCGELGVPASFAEEVGPIARTICSRARWTDLIVLNLRHPPEAKAKSRLTSGIRKMIHSCARPILVVPEQTSRFSKVLLAFDGSRKSRQALYIATYIAGRWQSPLVVVCVAEEKEAADKVLVEAQDYLKGSNIQAAYYSDMGKADRTILDYSIQYNCDLIILGGYSSGPVMEVIRGSVVDGVLRQSNIPSLICP